MAGARHFCAEPPPSKNAPHAKMLQKCTRLVRFGLTRTSQSAERSREIGLPSTQHAAKIAPSSAPPAPLMALQRLLSQLRDGPGGNDAMVDQLKHHVRLSEKVRNSPTKRVHPPSHTQIIARRSSRPSARSTAANSSTTRSRKKPSTWTCPSATAVSTSRRRRSTRQRSRRSSSRRGTRCSTSARGPGTWRRSSRTSPGGAPSTSASSSTRS